LWGISEKMISLSERIRGYLQRRQAAYQTTFAGPGGEVVLADIFKFCRMYKSTFHPDPRVAANLDGRREVALRIQQHLKLTDEQLWSLIGRTGIGNQ
jgi:hypothetical protein